MNPVLAAIGLGLGFLAASGRSSTSAPAPPPGGGSSGGASGPPGRSGGPTVPAGAIGTPSGGGGGGEGSGGPPRPRGLAPAFPFPGRATVEALAASEHGLSPASRDQTVAAWLRAGQLDPIRWVPVPVRGSLVVFASSDAVGIGGVRLCCSQRAAQWVADAHYAMTPTGAISDAIWRASTLRIAPFILSSAALYNYDPGGAVRYWLEEQDGIARALAAAPRGPMAQDTGGQPVHLIATVGKDYVLDARLEQNPDHCAIYGWHQLNGVPIQTAPNPAQGTGASLKHELSFFDYSHSVRIVSRRAMLDGAVVDLADVYRHRPELVVYVKGQAAPPVRHPGVPPWQG